MPYGIVSNETGEIYYSPEDVRKQLRIALEQADCCEVQRLLGIAAKTMGMTKVSRTSGVSRESLYRSLSEEGNPSFQTIMRVLTALGFTISITAAKKTSRSKSE